MSSKQGQSAQTYDIHPVLLGGVPTIIAGYEVHAVESGVGPYRSQQAAQRAANAASRPAKLATLNREAREAEERYQYARAQERRRRHEIISAVKEE